VAWGGIEMAVPSAWEPRRVTPDHLVFESGGAPAMEIKWGAGGGRPLKRLARGVRREGGAYRETPLPPEWQLALPGREGSAFAWEAGGRRAVGACVRCRECGTVSLVQFFERGDAEGGRRALRVLSSLADHRRGHRTRWRLFDISADLPRDFRLAASRFQPGRFELCFSRTRRALTLWRWAPAAALLQGRTLSEFAGTAAGAAGLRFEPATVNGFAGVAATRAPAGIMGRLAARIGLSRPCAVRVWHLPACNRILAVQLQGPAQGLDAELDAICRDYGVDEPITVCAAADRP
jgi:hypothetical protein